MAGTLTISTLSDGTNSTSATNPILGSAKAWVCFNGTGTVAIRASYNVSSITDNGTGDYTINFTNALANANYCATGTVSNNASTGSMIIWSYGYTVAPTTTTYRFLTGTNSATFDSPYVMVAIFSS